MSASLFKVRFCIEGVMPERALLRLRRAQIAVYDVKKLQKNRLAFTIRAKDYEKVFAIYPKTWYNTNGHAPYRLTFVGDVGVLRVVKTLRRRVGVWLGALAFAALCLYADGMIFGVEVVGAPDYAREAREILGKHGVRTFATYERGKEDLVCAELLACDGVEFCSVQKRGLWLRVEIRKGNFHSERLQSGDMTAEKSGKITAIRVLSGTPLKAVGDEVREGESVVGAWFEQTDGERIPTDAIAVVQTECVFRLCVEAEDEESAFAIAYLAAELRGDEDWLEVRCTATAEGVFETELRYGVTQSRNVR